MEIQNESQSKQNRINEEIIKELQHKTNALNEKLTILKIETEENEDMGKEELFRMKEKLKETEEEMLVLKAKRDKMVIDQMSKSPAPKTLSMSKSNAFLRPKRPERARMETEPNNQGDIDSLRNSVRYVKPNKSFNRRKNNFGNKDKMTNNVSFGNFLTQKSGFSNRKMLDSRKLDERLQEYFKTGKAKSPGGIERKRREKLAKKKKTDWFISVINSLDKKLKDIKVTMGAKKGMKK